MSKKNILFITKIKFIFYVTLFFLATIASNAQASNWLEVRTLDGKITALSQHFEDGKWTLVMLWARNCGICVHEYPVMSEFHDRHKNTDAKVIGISLDGYSELEQITQYIEDMPMTFDNLIGEVSVVAFNYQTSTEEPLRGTPTYLMFNPKGQLVAHNPGPVEISDIEKFIHR